MFTRQEHLPWVEHEPCNPLYIQYLTWGNFVGFFPLQWNCADIAPCRNLRFTFLCCVLRRRVSCLISSTTQSTSPFTTCHHCRLATSPQPVSIHHCQQPRQPRQSSESQRTS